MATTTTNLGLTKPATTELYNIGVANTNMDLIDAKAPYTGTFTPTVSSTVGAITSFGTLAGAWTRIGDLVTVVLTIPITNNGTGSGSILVSNMPFTCFGYPCYGAGREQNVNGLLLSGYINADTTNLYIAKYDASYPAGNGYLLGFSITYKVA